MAQVAGRPLSGYLLSEPPLSPISPGWGGPGYGPVPLFLFSLGGREPGASPGGK